MPGCSEDGQLSFEIGLGDLEVDHCGDLEIGPGNLEVDHCDDLEIEQSNDGLEEERRSENHLFQKFGLDQWYDLEGIGLPVGLGTAE